jgi:hypothetical protein
LFQNKKQIASRIKQWEMYNVWETSSQWIMEETDPVKLLRWYSSAWEMARTQNPAWCRQEVDQGKIRRLQKIRNTLALLGGNYERS